MHWLLLIPLVLLSGLRLTLRGWIRIRQRHEGVTSRHGTTSRNVAGLTTIIADDRRSVSVPSLVVHGLKLHRRQWVYLLIHHVALIRGVTNGRLLDGTQGPLSPTRLGLIPRDILVILGETSVVRGLSSGLRRLLLLLLLILAILVLI